MTTILDAPSALGMYMLKGWVLTNRSCPNTGCRIPLLRSPAGQNPIVQFCVNCDPSPDAPRQSPIVPPPEEPHPAASTSASSASHLTRTSTPATEVSDASGDIPPFVETEENRRRREQTDRASAEIGRRLLQGWTMLGDECPRESCYYVPLVRPPKAGGEQDPRKECVLCGSIYTTERDYFGREQLVLMNGGTSSQTAAQTVNQLNPAQSFTTPSQQVHPSRQAAQPSLSQPTSVIPSSVTQNPVATSKAPAAIPPIMGTLESSAEALQLSLQALTSRLTSLTSNSTLVDPISVATTADAISKVTQALSQVKQLQWSETQAHAMT